MTNATITVQVGGSTRTYNLEDIDMDGSRDKLSLKVGNAIVDGIWEEVEG